MKPLAEMNLVDDFLMSSLTSSKEYGEPAMRYILGCILQRKIGKLTIVPQRFLPAAEPESHGVRLDVYLDEEGGEIFDVEPDQNNSKEDISALPRRGRFYHAKIDAANLKSGSDYKDLRNVIVIFITTYDPFGENRMIYTFRNRCDESPNLEYDDGARTIFLYTKGENAASSSELQQLLRYMEHSCSENASTTGLIALDHMVQAVKQDGKVGFTYMKSFEILERERRQGLAEGKAEGLIETALDFGLSENEIQERLIQKLGISAEKAQEYLGRYLRT